MTTEPNQSQTSGDKELLSVGTRIQHTRHGISGVISKHVYCTPEKLSVLPYRVEWDDMEGAEQKLGVMFEWPEPDEVVSITPEAAKTDLGDETHTASKAGIVATQKARQFFLDTEFVEAGRHAPIKLISIGIVSDDGREYYAESQEFDPKTLSPWLKENVLPHLGPVANRKPVALIAKEVVAFIGDVKPEFWGYYADYDWVVFCQMFGSMIDLPKGWPMYCRDIKQLCDSLGNPKLPEQDGAEHNALSDAKWNEKALRFLLSEQGGSSTASDKPETSLPAASVGLETLKFNKPVEFHPERYCQKCRQPNITWFVNNALWNRVTNRGHGIYCPVCFVKMAEAAGVQPTAWKLVPENHKSSGAK